MLAEVGQIKLRLGEVSLLVQSQRNTSNLRRVVSGQFAANDFGALDHGSDLSKGHIARQILQPAVRRYDDALRAYMCERAADACRYRFGCFDRHVGQVERAKNDGLPGRVLSTEQSRPD